MQLIHAEAQCGENLAIEPLELLRRCGGQSLIEQRLPAENAHHKLCSEPVITGAKLREAIGMKQFRGVGFFALHPQKNFERHGASGRNGHGRLWS